MARSVRPTGAVPPEAGGSAPRLTWADGGRPRGTGPLPPRHRPGAVGQVADPSRAAAVGDLRPRRRGSPGRSTRRTRARPSTPWRPAARPPTAISGATLVTAGRGLRGLPAAAGARLRQRGHPDAPAGRACWSGQAAQHVVLDGDDSLRGRPMTPDRAAPARDGRRRLHRAGRDAADRGERGRAAAGHRAPPGGGERAGQELPPAGRPLRGGRDLGARAVALPRPHGADARGRGRRRAARGGRGGRARARSRDLPPRPRGARRLLVGRPAPRRRRAAGRPRGAPAGGQPQPEAHGPAGRDAPDGRRRARGAGAARRGRAGRDARGRPLRLPAGHRGRAGGGAAR